jgi:uncharacterized protein
LAVDGQRVDELALKRRASFEIALFPIFPRSDPRYPPCRRCKIARRVVVTSFAPIPGLIGGTLIGLSAVVLMLTIGRIAGICGIVVNAMTANGAIDRSWRLAFILGLLLGALLVTALGWKDWSSLSFPATMPMTVIAGLLVGAGTTLGSGCTSGHGICGLARFSMRSIVATGTFMVTGAATVFILRHMI